MRNTTDQYSTTSQMKGTRPDALFWLNGALVLKGEEKAAAKELITAEYELFQKLGEWSTIFYGDLPFTFGYATGG